MTAQPHTHLPAPRRRPQDTAIPSDGLTLDTAHGPADLVVAWRLLAGQPTPATLADTTLAYRLAKGGTITAARPLAAALGVNESTARRGIDRAKAAAAKQAAAQADTPQAVAA